MVEREEMMIEVTEEVALKGREADATEEKLNELKDMARGFNNNSEVGGEEVERESVSYDEGSEARSQISAESRPPGQLT